ncbi:SDR family NAD(P)-dependent oxidoreductase [Staphylococcus edaphicus]|uniref:Short-chain dehydrogenase n=1 Tax=Staphylococcus edaphicus TaxID=1955013 RepID=A0A2C6WMD9_9STAP|nr:SDR family NAD(P)-dependent oxidoreductase [Staphylococcus edaphicus]PHK49255.1 short-chain dehydrogenase [Staphylococcus edaphicus]
MIGRHYVLTGGTSGLGQSILHILLQKQVYVTVLVRNPDKLKMLQSKYGSSQLTILQCDLQSPAQIANLSSQFKGETIDGIIYSAGLGYFKSMDQHTNKDMLDTYTLNLINFNLLLTTLQPHLSQMPTIVGIGSQSAFLTQAYAAHYGASKAAFNQVLNALRIEKPNYHVLTVNTGPIATPFHAKADPSLAYSQKYKKIMLNSDKLAEQIINGIITKKIEINKPRWMHMMLKIYQLAPRFIEKHFTFLFKNKI